MYSRDIKLHVIQSLLNPFNFSHESSAFNWKKFWGQYQIWFSKYKQKHTLMVASSEAVTITENTGWNMTRVTGARWPLRAYLSGGRGIHSLGSLFWPTGPPCVISSFASFNFDSNSITCSNATSKYKGATGLEEICLFPLKNNAMSKNEHLYTNHFRQTSNRLNADSLPSSVIE